MSPETVEQIPELLPCRRCGQRDADVGANAGWFTVECNNCPCRTSGADGSAAEAIAAWNRRPSSEAGKGEAEAVERYNIAVGKCLAAGGVIDNGDNTEWWKALIEAQQYGGALLSPEAFERARTALQPGHKP